MGGEIVSHQLSHGAPGLLRGRRVMRLQHHLVEFLDLCENVSTCCPVRRSSPAPTSSSAKASKSRGARCSRMPARSDWKASCPRSAGAPTPAAAATTGQEDLRAARNPDHRRLRARCASPQQKPVRLGYALRRTSEIGLGRLPKLVCLAKTNRTNRPVWEGQTVDSLARAQLSGRSVTGVNLRAVVP